jgi:hypothetical protein
MKFNFIEYYSLKQINLIHTILIFIDQLNSRVYLRFFIFIVLLFGITFLIKNDVI